MSIPGTNLHKATPEDPTAVAWGVCAYCDRAVKHLPAGQGWVHTDSGMVVAGRPVSYLLVVIPEPVDAANLVADVRDVLIDSGFYGAVVSQHNEPKDSCVESAQKVY